MIPFWTVLDRFHAINTFSTANQRGFNEQARKVSDFRFLPIEIAASKKEIDVKKRITVLQTNNY